jgi:ABC-2 type transport system permease protein
MKLLKLVQNEIFKMIYKKRLIIVFGILLVLISAFAYGESRTIEKTKERLSERLGVTEINDWKKLAEQRILEMKNRLDSPHITDKEKASLNVNIDQYKYFIENNINPVDSSDAKFTTRFMEQSIFLFLPLLIILLAGDMVSGESSAGTIKLLLTRNVPRWEILLSKYITLLIMSIIVLLISAVISIAVSGIFFGYGGWMTPVATGFKIVGDKLDTLSVINVPQWQYAVMVYGLAYFVSIVVGSISFMISVLVRSTAASIGIMMSALIAGTFLSRFISDWEMTRYLFMANLRLTDYLSGSFQPIEGINMVFSITVLSIWAICALAVSFIHFTKQDILV